MPQRSNAVLAAQLQPRSLGEKPILTGSNDRIEDLSEIPSGITVTNHITSGKRSSRTFQIRKQDCLIFEILNPGQLNSGYSLAGVETKKAGEWETPSGCRNYPQN
jgi:hypothetical protein